MFRDDHLSQELRARLSMRVGFAGGFYPAQSDDGDDEQDHEGEQNGARTRPAAEVFVVDEHADQDAEQRVDGGDGGQAGGERPGLESDLTWARNNPPAATTSAV